MLCENIIDTVDLLLTDRVRDILRVGDSHLNTISVFGDRCICLLSFYGSCVSIRSTLSFPTARSIFKLPAVCILKNLPVCKRENAL